MVCTYLYAMCNEDWVRIQAKYGCHGHCTAVSYRRLFGNILKTKIFLIREPFRMIQAFKHPKNQKTHVAG